MTEWAMAHPYLTTLLGLAAMLLGFVTVDYAGTGFGNAMIVLNNHLQIKASETRAKAEK